VTTPEHGQVALRGFSRRRLLRWPTLLSLLLLAGGLLLAAEASAQQVTTTTRNVGVSERFYENIGVGFGFGMGGGRGRVRTWSRIGPGHFPLPPFGQVQPSAGLSAGWSVRTRGGFSANFSFHAGQGVQRNHTSSSAVVTGLAGYPTLLTDRVYAPFVTGFVPMGAFYNVAPRVPYRQVTLVDRWREAQRRERQLRARRSSGKTLEPKRAGRPKRAGSTPPNLAREAFRQLGGRPRR